MLYSNFVLMGYILPDSKAHQRYGCVGRQYDTRIERYTMTGTTHLWIPPLCQAVFDRMRTCDRMQSFIRPQRCGDLMAAGRYGYAQRRVQIKFESLQLFGLIWFSRSGSLRSFSHAIRRPPHTSRAPGRGVARAALTPSPPDLDNSSASSACVVPLLASNGWVGVSIPSDTEHNSNTHVQNEVQHPAFIAVMAKVKRR